MNEASACRLLVAAGDDPVLAAWVSVIHENRMPAHTEVTPYDHLEAFQSLFAYGYLSSREYNSVNEKKTFFSGRTPLSSDVQGVLDNLHTLPVGEQGFETMKKQGFDAFRNQSAIAPARQQNGLAPAPSRVQLNQSAQQSVIQAFAPRAPVGIMQQNSVQIPSPAMGNIPSQPQGLQCSTPDPMMMTSLNAQLTCCGVPVQLRDVGGDSHEGGVGEQPFIEYAFDASCDMCGTDFCIGASKPYPRGSFG